MTCLFAYDGQVLAQLARAHIQRVARQKQQLRRRALLRIARCVIAAAADPGRLDHHDPAGNDVGAYLASMRLHPADAEEQAACMAGLAQLILRRATAAGASTWSASADLRNVVAAKDGRILGGEGGTVLLAVDAVAVGAVSLVVRALLAHGKLDARVCEAAAHCLTTLSVTGAVLAEIHATGGVDLVIRAASWHDNDPAVLREVLAFIRCAVDVGNDGTAAAPVRRADALAGAGGAAAADDQAAETGTAHLPHHLPPGSAIVAENTLQLYDLLHIVLTKYAGDGELVSLALDTATSVVATRVTPWRRRFSDSTNVVLDDWLRTLESHRSSVAIVSNACFVLAALCGVTKQRRVAKRTVDTASDERGSSDTSSASSDSDDSSSDGSTWMGGMDARMLLRRRLVSAGAVRLLTELQRQHAMHASVTAPIARMLPVLVDDTANQARALIMHMRTKDAVGDVGLGASVAAAGARFLPQRDVRGAVGAHPGTSHVGGGPGLGARQRGRRTAVGLSVAGGRPTRPQLPEPGKSTPGRTSKGALRLTPAVAAAVARARAAAEGRAVPPRLPSP